jgi:hypothetical protein
MPLDIQMRDNLYLQQRLNFLLRNHFFDAPRLNNVLIKFGRKAFRRLGSIRRVNITDNSFDTLILINGYFQDPLVPEYVLDATIAHEYVHYIQGVSSPYPSTTKRPHSNGRVEKELDKRQLSQIVLAEQMWLRSHWKMLAKQAPNAARPRESLAARVIASC